LHLLLYHQHLSPPSYAKGGYETPIIERD